MSGVAVLDLVLGYGKANQSTRSESKDGLVWFDVEQTAEHV